MKTADLLFTVSYDTDGSFPYQDYFFKNGHGVRNNSYGESTFRWQVRDGRVMYRTDASTEWMPEAMEAQIVYERYINKLILATGEDSP